MGIFGKKPQPTRPGSYKSEWPKESGLGVRSHQEEQDAQERYLIYTSERRRFEPVAAEDMETMDAAMSLLYRMSGGTPVNEVPLIQGPVDIQWFSPGQTSLYVAEALVTDRRFIMWWTAAPGRRSQLVVLDHLFLTPRSEKFASVPYQWNNALVTDYPVQVPAISKGYHNPAVTIGVHFSSDGHSNRRSMSIKATLNEIEDRRLMGTSI